jgi:transcriptional regulator with XRE-family HTH domain
MKAREPAVTWFKDQARFDVVSENPPSTNDRAPRRRRPPARPSEVDRHVGARIRMRRILLGLSQHQLADRIGVTYQQQHKYERGTNRVSAGRLHAIARALEVGVDYFFEGLDEAASNEHDLTLELSRAFVGIGEKRHQEAICLLARALAHDAVP